MKKLTSTQHWAITGLVAFLLLGIVGVRENEHRLEIADLIPKVQRDARIMEQRKPWVKKTAVSLSNSVGRFGGVVR